MKYNTLITSAILLCLIKTQVLSQNSLQSEKEIMTMEEYAKAYREAGLTIPEFISSTYCGGDSIATLNAHGKEGDGFEWFIEDPVDGSLRKIGEGKTIEVNQKDFDRKVVCRRNCDCYHDYKYESVLKRKRPMRVAVKERKLKKDKQSITFNIIGGNGPFFLDGLEVPKSFEMPFPKDFRGKIVFEDVEGCSLEKTIRPFINKSKKKLAVELPKGFRLLSVFVNSGGRNAAKRLKFDQQYCFFAKKKGKANKCPKI